MASVYRKGDRWYLRFRDQTGRWRDRSSAARSKTEARRLVDDLERKCERQRLGLEAVPDADGGGTFAALLDWWLLTYSKASPLHARNTFTLKKHLLDSELAPLRLVDVTSGKIESFLQAKSGELGPQSLNHLRRFILTADTKSDTDWLPFEIAHAVDECQMPIIAAYPDYDSILAPAQLSNYWPQALASRIKNGTARVIHIPFKIPTVLDAVDQFDVGNTDYPTNGYGFYSREAHVQWGLIKP